jgi:alpha-ribazole phosphatase
MTPEPSVPAKRLWALRHPPVASFAGAVGHHELPLLHPVEQSLASAALATPALFSRAELPLRAVVTSPRHRCRAAATALAAARELPLTVDERLREIEHGRWAGRTWDEIAAYDHAAYHAWLARWIDLAPPGGESALELTARVRAALLDAPPDALLVTHRGPLQALHHLAGAPWPEAAALPCPLLGEPGALLELHLVTAPSFALHVTAR